MMELLTAEWGVSKYQIGDVAHVDGLEFLVVWIDGWPDHELFEGADVWGIQICG